MGILSWLISVFTPGSHSVKGRQDKDEEEEEIEELVALEIL